MEKAEPVEVPCPSPVAEAVRPIGASKGCARLLLLCEEEQVDLREFASWLRNKVCGVHCGALSGAAEEAAFVRTHVAGKLEKRAV
jgi:hypothetical protein